MGMKSGTVRLLGVVAVVLAVSGFQFKEAPHMATLSVDFSWSGIPACSSRPPAFAIGNIPAGTKTLAFNLTDLNVPTFHHGGGTVAYTGNGDIPAGAFTYTGPCPPSGSHEYRWDVRAINAAGDTILGEGSATKPFPPY